MKHWAAVTIATLGLTAGAAGIIPVDIQKFIPADGNSTYVKMDTEVSYNQKSTLRFEMPEFSSFYVAQPIQVKPDTPYLLRAVMRLDNPYIEERGYAGLHFIVSDSDENYVAQSTFLTAVADWKAYELAFRSDTSGTMFVIFGAIEGKGRAWLGELTLTEVTEAELGDVTPADPAAAREDDSGFFPYQDHPQEVYFPTRVPPEEHRTTTIAVTSAGNQDVQTALGIYAGEALQQFEVAVVGNLNREDGMAQIDGSGVEIRYLTPEPYYIDALRFYEYPIFLRKNVPVDIPAHENRRFFLTIRVPAGTPAGIYRAPIALRAAGQPEKSATLQLEVYPFDLEESDHTYFFYHNTAFDARIAADMACHGLNSVTIYDSPTLENDRLSSLIDYFAREMHTGKLFHAKHPPLYLYCGANGLATFTPSRELAAPLVNAGHHAGWNEFYLYCVDEPNSPERIQEARQGIPQLREAAPDAKVATAIGIGGLSGGLAPLYDLLILDTMAMKELLPYTAAIPGGKFWIYECRMNGKSPMVDRYSFGVFNYAAGGSGCAQWVYFDPNRPDDGRAGVVYGYVLVEPDDIVPSIGYEAKREGINDARYIQMVEKRIAESAAPDSAAVRSAEATLAEIRQAIDLGSFRQRMSRMNGIEFRLDNLPQPGWTAEKPDIWRERLARHIIELEQ